MAWNISWEDSRGRHDEIYGTIGAVLEHVEYCLNHGMKVFSVYATPGKSEKKRCVFKEPDLNAEILRILGERGPMTVREIAELTSSSYRTDSFMRRTIRDRMYRLRDKGLIESVPNWENESKWRLVV